mmetsp:Transcript_7172/g.14106  ORF Transcript_7172/g.14106 Transcript_7172/m.14106 type:complete len:220 (+) Transcript_7172:197-856(+)|eukprot:CAMPEP_0182461864 /NCGR_PEP_ID=MMETSP1319-20130603/6314_1 /TAXON_ID=172717 /ORGANISM="Bolidomonas pacifica, Strain RCC208" /LENGTH=219 /DNA_ID=CAMNT_0024661217 /DNA_START=199 /DNA_END=858 /DNA_ORIENTATION=+
MSWFAKKKQTPAEAAKATKKQVRGSQREVDKEIRELERSEQQILSDIKKRARNAADPSSDKILRTLATQLVQVRKSKERCHVTKSQLGAMGMKAQAMKSQVALTQAVGKTASAMKAANSAVDVQKLNKTMQEFARQNERMDVTEEMMDSALADAFDDEGVEEEADELTGQVLAELGLELGGKMEEAPTGKVKGQGVAVEEEEEDLAAMMPDLQARLKAL